MGPVIFITGEGTTHKYPVVKDLGQACERRQMRLTSGCSPHGRAWRVLSHVTFGEDDVTAALPADPPAETFECLDYFGWPQQRTRWHHTVTSSCRTSMVSGNPSSRRTAKHSRIALRMLVSASTSVIP